MDSTQSTKPPVLLLKIMYLLLFGAVGSYEPFISVFFNVRLCIATNGNSHRVEKDLLYHKLEF